MRLFPKDASDRLVLPLLLWIPVGLGCMFGLQAARSGEEAASMLRTLGIITAVAAVPFAIGVVKKIK